jgi:putative flippase GtrA
MSDDSLQAATPSFFMRIRSHTIVRFAGVGVISTICDLTVLKVLYPYVWDNVYGATAIAFLCGLTVGFLLNGRYVFKQDHTLSRYLKYGLVSLGGLILTELIIHALHVDLHIMTAFKAKLVAVALVFFWNYGWSKVWAFK